MALEAKIIEPGPQAQILTQTAPADRSPGEIVQAGGRAGVVLGLNADALKSGKTTAVDTGAKAEVKSVNSSVTFTEGATVGWDDTANEAVAGGAGDFDIGKAEQATTTNGDPVRVLFNA